MHQEWTKIFETPNPIEARIVVDMLGANGINAVEMNKRDSSYTVFGRVEVYCQPGDVITAKTLLEQFTHEE